MKIPFLCFLLCANLVVNAQNDSITKHYTADFTTFVQLLEETHPDPYTAFGGRVEFRRTAQNMRKNIHLLTNVEDFRNYLSDFIAQLKDGHTFIYSTENQSNNTHANKYFPMVFNVASDGLFIHNTSMEYTQYIGYRI